MTNPFDKNDYPTSVPECIVMGCHVGWLVTGIDEELIAPDYTMMMTLNEVNGANEINISGSYEVLTDGSYWVFEVPSATSNAWPPETTDNEYRWDLKVTQVSTTNTSAIRTGYIKIFTSNSERLSHARTMLRKINSILEGRADNDVDSYSIKSRSLTRMSINDLLRWRDYYLNEVDREDDAMQDGRKTYRKNTVRVRAV